MHAAQHDSDGGYEHLCGCEDMVMAALVRDAGPLDLESRRRGRPDDAYGALVRTIVGQQLSTKAARAIYGRLTARFGGKVPTPEQLVGAGEAELRSAGLSRQKSAYLKDLASRVLDGRLELDRLDRLSEGEIISEITAVKGLGRWSADMFMMFHLGRPDVLPVGDLGIRRATQRAYDLSDLPSPEELGAIAQPWQPHRTLACLYLWGTLDNAPA